MAKASGTDLNGFEEQLATTALFCRSQRMPSHSPRAATSRPRPSASPSSCSRSRCSAKMPRPPGAVGVEFPDKTVFGDKDNVKFRYDSTFMKEAAEGKLQAAAQ